MRKYENRCVVMLNGAKIEDLRNYQSPEITHRQQVDTMEGTGAVDLVRKYTFSLDYVVPKDRPKFDWGSIEDATIVVTLSSGHSFTYSGVSCLNQGSFTLDGEAEGVMTITFIAGSMD